MIKDLVDDVVRIDKWSYDKAMSLLDSGGPRTPEDIAWAHDTEEKLVQIADQLKEHYPAEFQQLHKRISESLLDLMYLQSDGAVSLRLGRELNRRRAQKH